MSVTEIPLDAENTETTIENNIENTENNTEIIQENIVNTEIIPENTEDAEENPPPEEKTEDTTRAKAASGEAEKGSETERGRCSLQATERTKESKA